MGDDFTPTEGIHKYFSNMDKTHLAIPHYQRGYSWQQNHLDDFWNDLDDVISHPDDDYYFGTIVTIKGDKVPGGVQKYALVDGQQRMATVAIFLTVIRDIYAKIQSSLVDEVNRVLINDGIQKNREEYYKIRLDIDDNPYLVETIFQDDPKITDKRKYVQESSTEGFATRKNLRDAYLFFYDTIYDSDFQKLTQREKEVKLNEFRITLTRLFVITNLQVELESKAYILFDRLNSRGKDLEDSDLIKDFIFSIIFEEEKSTSSSMSLNDAIAKWETFSKSFDKNAKKINDFIHHYLNAFETKNSKNNFEITKKDRIYQKIQSVVKNSSGEDFLNNLTKKSSDYIVLKKAKSHNKLSNIAKDDLKWLSSLNVKNVYPLLLATLEKWNKKDNEKMIALCLKYVFRVKTVMNVNPTKLENELAALAFNVYHNNMNFKNVQEKLRNSSNNPSDAVFVAKMKEMDFASSSHLAYVLAQIIEFEQPSSSSDIKPNSSVEHIMPKTLSPEWIDYIKSNFDNIQDEESAKVIQKRYLNYLGNTTIISFKKNVKLGNKSYDEKLLQYLDSQINITNSLKKFKVWNVKSILKRQDMMVKNANKIWKI
jgi:uncharacterized protein with ParB-like and HNH nuclease domain